jgi:hypothetical protein
VSAGLGRARADVAALPPALRRTALALAALVLVSSAYFVQGAGMNPSSRFDLVRAIVFEHSLAIDDYAGNTSDKASHAGHFYTDKAPGLSFASVPIEAVARAIGWPRPADAPIALHVVTVAVIGTTSAVAAALLFLTLVGMGITRLPAALSVASWALGTNAFGYLTLYYGHQFAGALLAIAFGLLYASRGDSKTTQWSVPLAGAVAAFGAITEYPAGIAAALVFLYGLTILGWRRMVPFGAAALVPLGLWTAYNDAAFGGPLKLGYSALANSFHDSMGQGFMGPLGAPNLDALGEILFGEWRGLLPLSPFLVLAAPGAYLILRDPETRREGGLAVAIVAFFLLFNASYVVWSGGASMGPRHVVPMLPFAVVLVARALEGTRAMPAAARQVARVASLGLVGIGIAMCTMTVAVMPELLDQRLVRAPGPGMAPPDMHYPLTTFVVPSFARGYLSVKGALPNGQIGIASTSPGHERDSYNLGEALGLHGLVSLVPLGILWTFIAFAIVRAGDASCDSVRRPDLGDARDDK